MFIVAWRAVNCMVSEVAVSDGNDLVSLATILENAKFPSL